MCGLAGIARGGAAPRPIAAGLLSRMALVQAHRGPDGAGVEVRGRVGLAHVRLAVVDPAGGAQPMTTPDGRLALVYTGEVYNHPELRRELEALGHRFRTTSDTEVVLHAYAAWGADMLDRLNGQFALAIHDRAAESVFLARDRFGVRPLHYAVVDGDLYFASEIKALFAAGAVQPAPDYRALDEVFTCWAVRPPRTPFKHMLALEPGTWARWRPGGGAGLTVRRWFEPRFGVAPLDDGEALEVLDALLRSAVRLRLRADVPVGAYLSGGVDSSVLCALAAHEVGTGLQAFSLSFDDRRLDERRAQRRAAAALGLRHVTRHVRAGEIGAVFPAVVRHAETPLVRTAPAPMYLLAEAVKAAGLKVVLTGEGADEVFWGYDLFVETVARRFALRHPEAPAAPRLLDRLYPYLGRGRGEFWRRALLDAGPADDPLFSHLPRFAATAHVKDFYARELRAELAGADALTELRDALPPDFGRWTPLERAAWLELTTLLSPYLLGSQGDRMAMAHGVEGRFPYLDHRLFAFARALPQRAKVRGLEGKRVLRRWAAESGLVPPAIARRPKHPYRAPDAAAFFGPGTKEPEWVADVLEPRSLAASGYWDAAAVAGLVRRCRGGLASGVRENQAIVAILSTELWHREFIRAAAPAAIQEEVVCA